MSTKQVLDELVQSLPQARLEELVDFARFLQLREERQQWQAFGLTQLARAYGSNEPEYTEADIKRPR